MDYFVIQKQGTELFLTVEGDLDRLDRHTDYYSSYEQAANCCSLLSSSDYIPTKV